MVPDMISDLHEKLVFAEMHLDTGDIAYNLQSMTAKHAKEETPGSIPNAKVCLKDDESAVTGKEEGISS